MDKTVLEAEYGSDCVMKKNSPIYVVGFMVIMCALCGAAVSFVQFSMKTTLDANALLPETVRSPRHSI